MKSTKSGFALIELLIAIAMAAMIGMVIVSLIPVLLRVSAANSNQVDLEEVKAALAYELSNAIRWSDEAVCDGASNTIQATLNSLTATYTFDTTVSKNGERLIPTNVRVTSVSINDYSAYPTVGQYPSCVIEMDLQATSGQRTVVDHMRLVVSKRRLAQ